jgi:MraZ protein
MEQMFFLGQFYHSLDDKGRLTVPARFREFLLTEGGFIMQGFDQNLMVLPSSTFNAYSRTIQRMNIADESARLLRRMLYSSAYQVEFDKAGRILVPQVLRQYAAIENEVVFAGNGDYFEIWAVGQWALQTEKLQDAETNAHRFATLNLASDVVYRAE